MASQSPDQYKAGESEEFHAHVCQTRTGSCLAGASAGGSSCTPCPAGTYFSLTGACARLCCVMAEPSDRAKYANLSYLKSHAISNYSRVCSMFIFGLANLPQAGPLLPSALCALLERTLAPQVSMRGLAVCRSTTFMDQYLKIIKCQLLDILYHLKYCVRILILLLL